MADFNHHPLCKSLAARDGSQSFNHGLKDFQHLRLVPGVVVAKRFTDTEKWKKRWFRELGSKLRDVRQFILDDCDLAGIWEIDLPRLSYNIGEAIALEDIKKAFKDDLQLLSDGDSIHVPAFIEFQYGTLVTTNNAHRAVIKRLRSKGVSSPWSAPDQPLTSPSRGAQDKDKDKDKDQDQEKDKDKDRLPGLTECVSEYQETLNFFKIGGTPGLAEGRIASLLQRYGFESTRFAIIGMRFEPKTETFNPANCFSSNRLADSKLFEKFVNLGRKASVKTLIESDIQARRNELEVPRTDPARVREILSAGFGRLATS